jgi:hypothetical protein
MSELLEPYINKLKKMRFRKRGLKKRFKKFKKRFRKIPRPPKANFSCKFKCATAFQYAFDANNKAGACATWVYPGLILGPLCLNN